MWTRLFIQTSTTISNIESHTKAGGWGPEYTGLGASGKCKIGWTKTYNKHHSDKYNIQLWTKT